MDLFSLEDTQEVIELERNIPKYAKAYYESAAIISDYEFDQLVDRLRELKPNSAILHTPGWGYKQTGNKLKHKYQIVKSLDKCRTWDEIPDRFKNKDIALSPKLDGLTGVFYYEKGKLVRAITRGNGQEGKDITDKAMIIVGNEIKDKNFTGGVRGELEIPNENWEIIKDKYPEAKNARNLCAGWINSKEYDPEEIELIHFITYKITGQENDTDADMTLSKFDVIDWLADNFEDAIPKVVEKDFNINTFNQNFMENVFMEFKKKLDYELDGIVISDMNVIYDKNSYSYIYDECAFKFAAEEKETTINNIAWELSRTQRYVPVLEIEPVELSGATVQNVTGNNAKYLVDNGLGVGAVISVCRSGEVIPKHMSTLEPADANLPTHCPYCNSELQWVGVDLKCVNKECPHIDESNLEQWCTVVGETDGLAWTTMKQYLDAYKIFNVKDLYVGNGPTMLEHLKSNNPSITDLKVIEFLNKLLIYDVPVEKALIGLNIPRLNTQTAKLLNREEELINSLVQFSMCWNIASDKSKVVIPAEIQRKLLDIVKDATTEAILSNIKKVMTLYYLYSPDMKSRIIYNKDNGEVVKVAVTGSLNSMKRSAFEKYIQSYGYELSSSIKSCRYLITNNPNSGSSKNKDAQKYGVEIITEQAFLDKLGGNKKPSNTLF